MLDFSRLAPRIRYARWISTFALLGLVTVSVSAAALDLKQGSQWEIPVYLTSGFCGFLLWRYFPWGDSWNQYLSFGGGVLVAWPLNRLVYIADYLIGGERLYGKWPVFSNNMAWDTFLAEIITVAGIVIVVMTWFVAGGAKYPLSMITTALSKPRARVVLIIMYVQAVFVIAISFAYSSSSEGANQLINTMVSAGSCSLFFLIQRCGWGIIRKAITHVSLSIPFLLLGMRSASKESIIVALIPILIVLWHGFRNPIHRLMLIISVLFIVGSLTDFSRYIRDETWGVNGKDTSIQELASNYAKQSSDDISGDFENSGLASFLKRANAGTYRGWAVSIADYIGYQPGLVFQPLTYLLVPRFIWPGKPANVQGYEYTLLVFGRDINSSTSAGLFTGFYLGAGWSGVIIASTAFGLLMAGLTRLSWKTGGSLLYGLYSFTMFPVALRLDELWSAGALTGPIIIISYLIVLYYTSYFVSGFFIQNDQKLRTDY